MWARLGFLVVVLLLTIALAHAEEPDEAAQLLAQAAQLEQKGKYKESIPPAERALALREAALGPEHLQVAEALNLLGKLVINRGDNARAEVLLRRALAIRERALGPDHLATLESAHSLGWLLTFRSEYAPAGKLLDRALAGRRRALGPEHPAVAEVLATLATFLFEQGEYERAAETGKQAIAIYERAPGPHALALVPLLARQGIRILHTGADLTESEQLYVRAIRTGEAAGPDHPVLAMPLLNFGALYVAQGDHLRALQLYQRASRLAEAALGPTHRYTLLILGNIGDVYRHLGDYQQAEPHERRTLEGYERVLGPTHFRTAVGLHDLADVYRHQRRFPEADRLLLRALPILESKGNSIHIAGALTMLARVYHDQGMFEKSEPLYQRAISMWETTHRISTYEFSPHLGYAALLARTGRTDEAAVVLKRMLSQGEGRLRLERRTMSDARLGYLLHRLRNEEELTCTLLRRHPASTSLQRLALSFALLRKGRSIEEMAGTSRALARDLSPQDQAIFMDLRSRYGRLAALSLAGPGKLPQERYVQTIKDLTEGADRLEQELSTRSFRIRAQRRIPGPDEVIPRVAELLPQDAALVEIVAYADIDDRIQRGALHYLALVLHPTGKIAAVDLGPAAPIDDAAARLRLALQDPRSAYLPLAQDLDRRVLRPLRTAIGAARHLLLSPDGALNQIPFAVLHDAVQFTYLTSGRDLLREERQTPATAVAILADPDFAQATGGAPGLATAQRDRGLSAANLQPLPGTRKEADAIHRLLPSAQLLLGKDATEAALLSLRAPAILHIATHGLFVADDGAASSQRGFQVGATAPANPLLRSALALAGAKQTQTGDGPDGLATALELSTMDLWGTKLVVLSACDTGRGQVRLGQGVYGLRRALSIAGAETLVTSLWKVDDQSTADLMTDFYRHLVKGAPRGDALTQAMAKMRQRKPHPYYWAPFILLGNHAPLPGLDVIKSVE